MTRTFWFSSVFSALSVLVVSNLASAVDFTVAVDSVRRARPGAIAVDARVTADVRSADFNNVRFRAFLVPEQPNRDGRRNMKGIALPGVSKNLSFPGSARTYPVQLEFQLPRVPRGDYLLGVVINSTGEFGETDRMNNVSENLVSLYAFSNPGPDPADDPNDLFLDTTGLAPRNGIAYHAWRLFYHSAPTVEYDLWANFFFIDLTRRKAFDGGYEKRVHLVNMGNDLDPKGERLNFDRYYNNPTFERLPSGNYYLMSWINHRETFNENGANNIDLEAFSASKVDFLEASDSWLELPVGDMAPKSKVVRLKTDYALTHTYTIDPASVPAGVTVTPMTGLLANATVTLQVDPAVHTMHDAMLGYDYFDLDFVVDGQHHPRTFMFVERDISLPVDLSIGARLDGSAKKYEFMKEASIRFGSNQPAAIFGLSSPDPYVNFTWPEDHQTILLASPVSDPVLSVGYETRTLAPGVYHPRIHVTYGYPLQTVELVGELTVLRP